MAGHDEAIAARMPRLAASVMASGVTVAVAESLTGGQLSGAFAAAEDASTWFRGGLVAYASEVKFDVLGVTPGPVITARCAREMAAGAARLMTADIGIAVTGVGGPGDEEGEPPGTVYAAVRTPRGLSEREWHFEGEPERVVEQTVIAVLDLVIAELG